MRQRSKRWSATRLFWLAATGLVLAIVAAGCNLEDITSTLPPANLEVITETTGSSLDLRGYRLSIVGPDLELTRDIAANATVRFVIVAKAELTVELKNVPRNCTVDDNPQTVQLSTETESTVTFKVACP